MVKAAAAAVLILVSMLHGFALAADVRLGTWNLMRLGNGDQKSYEAVAVIAATVDLLAIQEVMNEEGVARVEAAVEARTGEPWSVISSSPVGSSRYKESYAFLSRDSVVAYDEGAVSYLDRKNVFIREPFSAKFRTTSGSTFALATVHIIYGKGEADRVPELQELGRYWAWLEEVYPGESLLLAGDFNMPPNHPAFASLRQHAVPVITSGASTLSHTSGKFANLYDNIFVAPRNGLGITAVGVVNYPSMLRWTHAQARAHVSDHAPVFIQMGRSRFATGVQLIPQRGLASVRQSQPAANDAPFIRTLRSAVGSVPVTGDQAGGSIQANRNSGIYHLPEGCPSYGQISQRNLVVFASETEAITAQYRKAGNCR